MNNVATIFITPTNRILLIKLRHNNKWSIPSGNIEQYDKSIWDTAKREFHEEVGIYLNTIDIINKQSYNYNNTIIYIIYSKQRIYNFIPNNRVINIKFIKLNKLIHIINDPNLSKKIRSYTLETFKKIFSRNLIDINPLNINQFNPNQFNPNQFNPNQFNPNLFNTNLFNPNLFNPNPLNSNPSNIKTLIYIGEKYNQYIPFGGYHITIAKHNDIDVNSMINIVKRCINIFASYNGFHGWIMKQTTTKLHKELNGNYIIKIKSDTFNKFGIMLLKYGIKSIIFNYYLNLNTFDSNQATLKYSKYTQTYNIFNIYVIEHDIITNSIKWHLIH
jgi:hypothetical protein